MGLSVKIIEARKSIGMTQFELAEKIDVSERTISNWENGARPSRIGDYQKLAKVFNVSVNYLMKDDIDSRETTQLYLDLGRNIAKIAHFSSSKNFWMNYAICNKDETLLLPVKPAIKFMLELNKGVQNDYYKYDIKANALTLLAKDFLFKWHKFNRANLQLSKTSKTKLLIILAKIFTNDLPQTNSLPFFPEKPTLLLRNLLIDSLKNEEKLDKYTTDTSLEKQIQNESDYIYSDLWEYK